MEVGVEHIIIRKSVQSKLLIKTT